MKKYIIAGFLLSGFISNTFLAQEQKRLKLSDASLQIGYMLNPVSMGHLSEFKLIAPKSTLLTQNLSGFSANISSGTYVDNYFTAAVGIQFLNKEKKAYKSNPLLRLGITYNSGTHLYNGYHRYAHGIVDTLISQQTGQMYLIDSTFTEGYGMNLSSQQLRFDVSLIFRTNPEARWSIYGGIGFNFGAAFRTDVDISYNSYHYTNNPFGYTYASNYSNDSSKYEHFTNSTRILGGSVYLPLGVDFRIGKNRPFWKQTHLFYELKPSLNLVAIQGGSTLLNGVFQHGFGVRVTF